MNAPFPTLGTWARTIRGLEAAQLYHRARLQARRRVNDVTGGWLVRRRLAGAAPGPPRRLPVVSREAELHPPEEAEGMIRGEVRLLNQGFCHPAGIDWLDPEMSLLRLYHLHYFDFLWGFVAHPDRRWARDHVASLVRHWATAVRPGAWSPWHPYVVATRGWNLAQVLPVLFEEVPPDLARLLWLHGDQTHRNLERDVGGNHLLRNFRGLVAMALVLDEPVWLSTATEGIRRCTRDQVLPDGGHFERSPYYHAQVLVDLEEVRDLLAGTGEHVPTELDDSIVRMSRYLELISPPDGRLPVFNDGVGENARLGPISSDPSHGVRWLRDSGYLVARTGSIHLVFDVGRPAPPTLPAHGHCSLLSVEVTLGDRPLLVNCGSSEYDDPMVRATERGTLGHNTVMVDATEQSEIWSKFRMGRQAEPLEVQASGGTDSIVLSGAHDGFDRLPGSPRHSREVRVTDGEVRILDRVDGTGSHRVEGRWLVHPSVPVVATDEHGPLLEGARMTVQGPVRVRTVMADAGEASWVARSYGDRVPSSSVRWETTTRLPLEVTTTLTLEAKT